MMIQLLITQMIWYSNWYRSVSLMAWWSGNSFGFPCTTSFATDVENIIYFLINIRSCTNVVYLHVCHLGSS